MLSTCEARQHVCSQAQTLVRHQGTPRISPSPCPPGGSRSSKLRQSHLSTHRGAELSPTKTQISHPQVLLTEATGTAEEAVPFQSMGNGAAAGTKTHTSMQISSLQAQLKGTAEMAALFQSVAIGTIAGISNHISSTQNSIQEALETLLTQLHPFRGTPAGSTVGRSSHFSDMGTSNRTTTAGLCTERAGLGTSRCHTDNPSSMNSLIIHVECTLWLPPLNRWMPPHCMMGTMTVQCQRHPGSTRGKLHASDKCL